MKKYNVYCHTLKGKRYIGYTKKPIEDRLKEHIKDSERGSETYFHRAIRKHGHENIITEKLDECTTQLDAKKTEVYYIEIFDTFNNGYNMTNGGDGGNTKERYSKKQLKDWGENRSRLSSGMNNGNARPDVTRDDIIKTLCNYVKKTKSSGEYILRKEIDTVLKEQLSISSRLLVNRGIKNHTELVNLVNSKLESNETIRYNPYYRSLEERKQLSIQSKNWAWVTDGENNKRIKLSMLDTYLLKNKNYKQGRTLNK